MATVDEDGYFFIVDRKKDMIIRGGYNVYPREIEEVLYEHPAVSEAAVVGVPDDSLGEEVGAAVVLKPARRPSADDIRAFVKERVAAYKYPRKIWFLGRRCPRARRARSSSARSRCPESVATLMAATEARPDGPAVATRAGTILTDARSGPVRRWVPGRAGVKLAAKLAVRPDKVARRGAGLAAELAKIAVGRSEVEPPKRDRRFKDDGVGAEPRLQAPAADLPGRRAGRSTS